MNKYEKLMQDLKAEFDEERSDYAAKLSRLNDEANAACHKYNDQIHAINGLRQELQDEICDLYKFLKRFGNIGESITPFEYVTEDSKFTNQATISGSLNCDTSYNQTSGFAKTASIAAVALMPMALPAVWVGEAWRKRSASKDAYLQMQIDFDEQKTAWEHDLGKKRDEAKFYKTATEIADIYRALIATVRMAIRETVIPELMGIDAFLVADAIKNCIISDMDPREAEVLNIDSYKGTLYDSHYVFVKNVFDYYTMLVKFFTEPILTKIVEDNKITSAEKSGFKKKTEQIKQHTMLLESATMFGG